MSDGQDKSDDLIAELAKLMANTAGTEPEAKPAPRLVTLPEDKPAAPAPTIRIPGMDAPVTPAAPAPGAPPVSLRIPGMDQPAPATAKPIAPEAAAPKPAASFDFGMPPSAATSFKPEPMSNWQDREVPRPPVSVRPAAPAAASPEPKPAAPASVVARTEPVAPPAPAAEARPVQVVPAPVKPAEPQPVDPKLAGPYPAPEALPASDFDFDFGFSSQPPAPIATQPAKPAPAPTPAPASADPIADLIAADLDAAEPVSAQPAPRPAPAPVSPVARMTPQPAATAAARPAMPAPFRPPVVNASPQPAPRPQDRFGVAPSFGSPDRSAIAARSPEPPADPMDEIESLIGEAVRVELAAPARPSPLAEARPASPATPVVPPLTTGFAPRRAAIKDAEPQVSSAEEAILAAAAAGGGAEIGHVEPVAPRQSPYKRKAKPARERRASGGLRQYVGMAVAGTLLLAAGFGLYWVLGMGRGTTPAEAPVLEADATPVKEAPPPAAAPADSQQGSVVFGELDGTDTPDNEQLVPRDDSANTSVADVDQPVGADDAAAGSESELANRKVRTVTVRPDGTIVSGDEAVAGNEALPVDRPNVPDLPGADVQPSELLAAVPTNDAAPADPVAAAISESEPPADATEVASIPDTPAAAAPAAPIDPGIVAPIPVARPADRSVLVGGANQPVAALAPAAPVAAAPAAAATGSGPYVQLSSQPTEADAQASLRATQSRLSSVLGGRALAIRQVDLGAKGTWFRVTLPVNSFQEATQVCATLKANGTDCLPING